MIPLCKAWEKLIILSDSALTLDSINGFINGILSLTLSTTASWKNLKKTSRKSLGLHLAANVGISLISFF